VVAALRRNLADLGAQSDEALARVYATLGFVQQSLPADLQELLIPLGLHENYVDADYLERMAKQADPGCTRAQIDALMQALAVAGLLRDMGQATYEMHPLLTSYLRSSVEPKADDSTREKWTRAFVDVVGTLANALAPRELHEQRGFFHVHGQNLYHALEQAERVGINTAIGALTQSMGSFAENSRNFADAVRLYERRARNRAQAGDREGEAGAYHQLGNVAILQRDFRAAEAWYRKSVEIQERELNEKRAAATYHQLGMLAENQRDFGAAREWYHKSLTIREKIGDEAGMAQTYHQLGVVAQAKEDLAEAQRWCLKSLEIEKKLGHESGAALTLGQLGSIADDRDDYKTAAEYYLEAASVFERLDDDPNAATAYNLLGVVTENAGDWEGAERWYRQSLAIEERIKDAYGAATAYGNLGNLESKRGNYLESGRWYIKCIVAFRATHDPARVELVSGNFLITFREASPEEKRQMRAMWGQAGLGALPEDAG
jgi:tetratricopeptide (TPR) repeat protein